MPIHSALKKALEEAAKYRGATTPNPPVGAAALDANGEILSVKAHQKAGELHAEARVIEDLRARALLARLHTMVITLEPCNHTGKTPPCSQALIAAGVKRVVYGAKDPNPRVAGAGAERLSTAGIEVIGPDQLPADLNKACLELIAPFSKWALTGLPWITVKTAHSPSGSMIPPRGRKTFTSDLSLDLAHRLRRRADAILTGVGTVTADEPEFTVRRVPDHPGKSRWLIVLDRSGRTPAAWIAASTRRGFRVLASEDIRSCVEFLGSKGVLEVLVEAGPKVSRSILSSSLWDEHVVIQTQTQGPDIVTHVYRDHSKTR